ncbi:MAG: class F sortase [Acidimicrobiales bacterium]|nr:class F sortase [Acidimicrobiales bacterium]
MSRRRTLAPVVAAGVVLVMLAVGACGAPASSDADGDGATPAPPVESTTTAGLPIGDRIEPIGSAAYDPDEHRGPRQPTQLRIGALSGRDAAVVPVGLQTNGEMEIPPVDEVGWYELGVAPGETGSAVLAAHIAYDGVDGVFRYLDRLGPGDEVEIGFDDGTTERYRVTELAEYRKDDLPDDLFSRQDPERLVMITCGGAFNPQLRSYESNIVAYAEPVT